MGPIDLSSAGWFLLIVGIWELLFNRMAAALGWYNTLGTEGFLVGLASSGRLAMNATGIMALCLTCVILPRLAANARFSSLFFRIVLMLTSPLYLPLICVAVFRPVDPWLVFVGYLITTGVAVMLTVLTAVHRIDSSHRRMIIVLGIIQLLAATELVCRFVLSLHPFGILEVLPKKAYLVAEVLYVVLPIFAFFAIRPGRLVEFIKRPHLPALIIALGAAAVAAAAAAQTKNTSVLSLVTYRSLGITLSIPGQVSAYIVSFFFGTLLIGTLILPSKRWSPTTRSRRVGIGLGCIWMAGIQPTHPYQFILMLAGFLYLSRGLLDEILEPIEEQPAMPLSVPPDSGATL